MENNIKYINLITRHLTHQLPADEEETLFQWINQDYKNQIIFDEIKNSWDLSRNYDPEIEAIDIDVEWNKFGKNILPVNNIVKNEPVRNFLWLKIAASIAIIILTGSLAYYLFSGKETVLTSSEGIVENQLPDGSVISLNFNSTISYNEGFNEEKRVVKLVGEAFFNVKPDKTRPFIVEVEDLSVQVVGTTFNIRQIQGDKLIEIIVNSGQVKLFNKSGSLISLAEGESAIYDRINKTARKSEFDKDNFLSWKSKTFIFDNSNLEYIVNTLKRGYHVKIEFINPELKNCILTVSFRDQSLESVFKVLEATLDIKIENNNGVFEINGNGCIDKAVN